MHFSRLTKIWICLDLPDDVLAEVIVDAMRHARRFPDATPRDCPFHCPDWHDRFTRKCRVAWRLAFRAVRAHGGVPLITVEWA